MTAFKYPLLTGLDLTTKACLLVLTALDPPGLPVDGIDVNDRQPGALPQPLCQPAFS
jgi:hypothetical protein